MNNINNFSFINTYTLNNKAVEVDLRNIPQFSETSHAILNLWTEHLPSSLYAVRDEDRNKIYSFTGRVQSLQEMQRLLAETQDNRTLYKIIAFIKTAVLVAVVVVSLAAIALGGELGLLLGLTCGLVFGYWGASSLLFGISASEIHNIESRLNNDSRFFAPDRNLEIPFECLPGLVGGGFIMPLYEAYTRESRLERVITRLNESLTDSVEFNQNQLPQAHAFYTNATLMDQIKNNIDKKVQDFSEIAKGGNFIEKEMGKEISLQEKINRFTKAKTELGQLIDFYKQFDAIEV